MEIHEQHIEKCKICWNAAIEEAAKKADGLIGYEAGGHFGTTANVPKEIRSLKVNK